MATSKRWKQYEQVAFPFSLNHTFSRLDECLEASGRGLAVWLASLTSAAAEARSGLARCRGIDGPPENWRRFQPFATHIGITMGFGTLGKGWNPANW